MRPVWFPDWSGEVCALVGSGPSCTARAVAQLKGRAKILVINTSVERVPFADALYACDWRWWDWHNGRPDFKGIRITGDKRAADKFGVHLIKLVPDGEPNPHKIVTDRPGVVGRGENSGFHALNLLVQFGAKRIVTLGIDFSGRRWHGAHPNGNEGQKPESLVRWAKTFDAQAGTLKGLGVDLVNISPVSALTKYPTMAFADALARWGVSDVAAA